MFEISIKGDAKNCISVQEVTKLYGKTVALNKLSFDIPCGEKVALLGPNGAGKSTMLKLLVGLLVPDNGAVSIMGYDPSSVEAKKLIGYLPEDASPYLTLSVRENLEYIGSLRGVPDVKDRTEMLLDTLTLRDNERAKVSKLSRGNRQKLSVALSIIHRPRIVLLDEPLNYLDIPTQEKVIAMLRDLNATFLVSTHIMAIAERLTDRAIVITRGKKVWSGTMTELHELGDPSEAIESIVSRLMTVA